MNMGICSDDLQSQHVKNDIMNFAMLQNTYPMWDKCDIDLLRVTTGNQ